MSISKDGVRIVSNQSRRRQHIFLGLCIAVIEVALSIVFYISLGAHVLYPDTTRAGTGAPNLLSYEGYLTDASGNPLGGTGTPYCFRFSIYDNPTVGAGSKLWPAGTPATTTATSTDGVFSALIGQADSLTYNFYDNDTTYFNVEVYTVAASGGTCTGGSWQTLSPRQQIVSSGYAITSDNIYGSLLQSQTANSRVQVGLGSGTPSPIYLGLDVKSTADYVGNACTTSGTIWYNSAISKALVCENGIVQAVSNSGATTTISGITANGVAAASTGTVVFSNSNGITFGLNGNTITASVSKNILSSYEPYPAVGLSTALVGIPTNTSAAVSIFPFVVVQDVSAGVMNFLASLSFVTVGTSSGRQSAGLWAGIYTRGAGANSTTIGSLQTTSFSWGITGNNSTYSISQITATNYTGYGAALQTTSAGSNITSGYTGVKYIGIPINTLLTPGAYWLAVMGTNSTSSVNVGVSMSLFMGVRNTAQSAGAPIGSYSTAYSLGNDPFGGRWAPGLGSWSSAGSVTGLPASFAFTSISAGLTQNPLINFWST